MLPYYKKALNWRRINRRRDTPEKKKNDNIRRRQQRHNNNQYPRKGQRAADKSALLHPPTSSKKREKQPLVELDKEGDTPEWWCEDEEKQDVDSASPIAAAFTTVAVKQGTTIYCTSSSKSSSAFHAAAYGTNICASNFPSLSTSSNVAAISPGSVQGQARGESTNLALEQYPRMDCLADAIAEELTSDEKGSVNEVRWPWELEEDDEEEGWEFR